MFVGNQSIRDVWEKLCATMQNEHRVSIPFVVVAGPMHVGKTTLVLQGIRALLGQYVQQDFLHVQDFSEQLKKPHVCKIETSTTETSDILRKDFGYEDIGVREVIQRLSKSPSNSRKIVLFENIERMNSHAANALLKSCEEPLPGRLIVATTSAIDRVLPTLVSRAFLLRMQPVAEADIETLLQEQFPTLTASQKKHIATFALGRPGVAVSLAQQLIDGIHNESSMQWWEQRQGLAGKEHVITERFQLLKKIDTDGDVRLFLDVLLVDAIARQHFIFADLIVLSKKMLGANVQKDAILLQLAMEG